MHKGDEMVESGAIYQKKICFLPGELYPADFPQTAAIADTKDQAFSVQSWFSFWLCTLHSPANRP